MIVFNMYSKWGPTQHNEGRQLFQMYIRSTSQIWQYFYTSTIFKWIQDKNVFLIYHLKNGGGFQLQCHLILVAVTPYHTSNFMKGIMHKSLKW